MKYSRIFRCLSACDNVFSPFRLGNFFWSGWELAVCQGARFAARGLRGGRHAGRRSQPLAEIAQRPAHHAVDRQDRVTVDLGRQNLSMRTGRPWRRSKCLAITQPAQHFRSEPIHAAWQELQSNAPNQRCSRSLDAVYVGGQRQQASGLSMALAPQRQTSRFGRNAVGFQSCYSYQIILYGKSLDGVKLA